MTSVTLDDVKNLTKEDIDAFNGIKDNLLELLELKAKADEERAEKARVAAIEAAQQAELDVLEADKQAEIAAEAAKFANYQEYVREHAAVNRNMPVDTPLEKMADLDPHRYFRDV